MIIFGKKKIQESTYLREEEDKDGRPFKRRKKEPKKELINCLCQEGRLVARTWFAHCTQPERANLTRPCPVCARLRCLIALACASCRTRYDARSPARPASPTRLPHSRTPLPSLPTRHQRPAVLAFVLSHPSHTAHASLAARTLPSVPAPRLAQRPKHPSPIACIPVQHPQHPSHASLPCHSTHVSHLLSSRTPMPCHLAHCAPALPFWRQIDLPPNPF